jgi:hypothetical protein
MSPPEEVSVERSLNSLDLGALSSGPGARLDRHHTLPEKKCYAVRYAGGNCHRLAVDTLPDGQTFRPSSAPSERIIATHKLITITRRSRSVLCIEEMTPPLE